MYHVLENQVVHLEVEEKEIQAYMIYNLWQAILL